MTRRTRFKAEYLNIIRIGTIFMYNSQLFLNKLCSKTKQSINVPEKLLTQILQLLGVLNRHTRDHVLAILVKLVVKLSRFTIHKIS